MFDKLEALLLRFDEVLLQLSSPQVADDQKRFRELMKEQSELTPIVEANLCQIFFYIGYFE